MTAADVVYITPRGRWLLPLGVALGVVFVACFLTLAPALGASSGLGWLWLVAGAVTVTSVVWIAVVTSVPSRITFRDSGVSLAYGRDAAVPAPIRERQFGWSDLRPRVSLFAGFVDLVPNGPGRSILIPLRAFEAALGHPACPWKSSERRQLL